jgi:hypothetical protein
MDALRGDGITPRCFMLFRSRYRANNLMKICTGRLAQHRMMCADSDACTLSENFQRVLQLRRGDGRACDLGKCRDHGPACPLRFPVQSGRKRSFGSRFVHHVRMKVVL